MIEHCIHSMNVTVAELLPLVCIFLSSLLCDAGKNLAEIKRVESKL